MLKQKESLATELATANHTHSQFVKDHELETRRGQELRHDLVQQLSELKAKEAHYNAVIELLICF